MICKFNPQRLMKKLGMKKNNIQEQKISTGMSEQNFKIYLRVKPSHVQDANYQILKIINNNKVEITSPYYSVSDIQKVYTYEQVFDTAVNNQKVFNQTMIGPISNVLQGFNSTVFIYGMTGAGKTYTMFGSIGSKTSTGFRTEEDGLVSMTIDYIFKQIQKQPHIKSQIIVSFYQIYNQNIRDLLQQQTQPLTIMEDPIRGVFINGLLEVPAEENNQIKDVISLGIQRRAMNATKSNQVSSRSHAILQFIVKRFINSNQNEAAVLQSKFFMIDLAGNQKTSNNQSRRFIQGVNINKSLLTLGKCLSILADRKGGYVPFRDSKLTRILKESLGGNSKTVMIACVSSQKRFYQQTLNTLKYSSIARKIKNKGIKHNLKVISKQQIPQYKNFVNVKNEKFSAGQIQQKMKQLLSLFLNAAEAKYKIQRLQEDLEISRKQNEDLLNSQEADSQMCKKNISKINDTLRQLMRPYEKQLEKVQKSYQDLMANINQIVQERKKSQNESQKMQIMHMKSVIADQQRKIKEYEQKLHSFSACHLQSMTQQFQNSANKSIDNRWELKSAASPQMHKQNSVPHLNIDAHLNQSGRSQSKNKKLTINCAQIQDTYRPALQTLNNSNSNLSENSRAQKKSIKFQRQIVINLNVDKVGQQRNYQNSRQQFVRRLKQTQKKVKGVQSDQISSLLEEHQNNRYQLGNTQMSMIRKLRFFQREKSLQKSHSLTKIGNRQSVCKNIVRKN